jgi:hypothetical protein
MRDIAVLRERCSDGGVEPAIADRKPSPGIEI